MRSLKYDLCNNQTFGVLKQLKVITVTHKRVSLEEVGQFHLEESVVQPRLESLKDDLQLEEMMYMSTCNRVEYVVVSDDEPDNDWLAKFYQKFNPTWDESTVEDAVLMSEVYEGVNAVEHLFNVASSLDSMVLGEREIITQVRGAFEHSNKMGITGDFIRLLIRKTIETGKEVYTQTEIASKPVSVVSLAHRKLMQLDLPENPRVIFIGAGTTNTTMARFVRKRGMKDLHFFNRTLANAEKLAEELGGKAYALEELQNFTQGFDVLISCTGASDPVVTRDLYEHLLQGETSKKIVVDLAIPHDVDSAIMQYHRVHYIPIEELKAISEENLKSRGKELQLCRAIISKNVREFQQVYRERQVELAMRSVPGKVKEIRERALTSVFAQEVEDLDDDARAVLNKVIQYLEKKYVAEPMKMAKDIMLNHRD